VKKKVELFIEFMNTLSTGTWFAIVIPLMLIGGGIVCLFFDFAPNPFVNYVDSVIAFAIFLLCVIAIVAISHALYQWISDAIKDIKESYAKVKKLAEIQESNKEGKRFLSMVDGKILDIRYAPGQQVKRGDTLFIIESCKMEMELLADKDGVIGEILVSKGDDVSKGDCLVLFL